MSLFTSVPNTQAGTSVPFPLILKAQRKTYRRNGKHSGQAEMPLFVDAEPYMNLIAAASELVAVLKPAMHVPIIGKSVERFVACVNAAIESVHYYESAIESKAA